MSGSDDELGITSKLKKLNIQQRQSKFLTRFRPKRGSRQRRVGFTSASSSTKGLRSMRESKKQSSTPRIFRRKSEGQVHPLSIADRVNQRARALRREQRALSF